jgi:hypothetical protein
MNHPLDRRRFLLLLSGAAALAGTRPARLPALTSGRDGPLLPGAGRQGRHPEPRPGIDGSRVLTAADLTDAPHAVDAFDAVRDVAHLADGIRCYCGCADLEGYRSLLSCYEAPGMARWCEICQGMGRLVHRRAREGQDLEQIRRAVDARYANGTAHHDMRGMGSMTRTEAERT